MASSDFWGDADGFYRALKGLVYCTMYPGVLPPLAMTCTPHKPCPCANPCTIETSYDGNCPQSSHCMIVSPPQVAQKAWDFYTTYTGVQLPLPKLDMVAVPGRSFAEPHWGLALFDERRFLFNQANLCCVFKRCPCTNASQLSH